MDPCWRTCQGGASGLPQLAGGRALRRRPLYNNHPPQTYVYCLLLRTARGGAAHHRSTGLRAARGEWGEGVPGYNCPPVPHRLPALAQ